MQLSGEIVSSLIYDIYDCAVDPSLWKPTLTRLRDMMQLSYMQVYMTSPPGSASGRLLSQTDWDQDWLAALQPLVPAFPAFRQMHASGLDAPQSALQLMDEAEFRKSGFFLEWCAPQALLDGCFTEFVARGDCDA